MAENCAVLKKRGGNVPSFGRPLCLWPGRKIKLFLVSSDVAVDVAVAHGFCNSKKPGILDQHTSSPTST